MPRRVEVVEYASESLVPAGLLKVALVDAQAAALAPADRVLWEHVLGGGSGVVRVAGLRFAGAPPGHLRRVACLGAAVVLDTFTRADSTTALGTGETGQAYTATAGTWGISSNRAYSATDADANVATLDSTVNDGTFECTTRGDLTATNYRAPGFLFRYLDVNNFLMVRLHNGACDLFKRDASAYTVLATAAMATADDTDYRLKAVCAGALVTVYVDDVQRVQHTLTGGDETQYTGATYTRAGMMLFKSGTPTVAARWDDLRVTRG